jgi:hypothetical protein
MTLLSTVCRFLIPAKQVGYLPGSTLSNDTSFIELKRSVDRMEDLTASLFYNPNSPSGHFSDRTFFVTPAVKRFSSLLSVINIDSLICLSPYDTSFVPFIALFGKVATTPSR